MARDAGDGLGGLELGLDAHVSVARACRRGGTQILSTVLQDWQSFLQDLHGSNAAGSRERSDGTGMNESELRNACCNSTSRLTVAPLERDPRNKHVADAKDITLPAARARVNSLGDWRTSPFRDHEKMDVDDKQDEQVDDGFDLGLDIGMDMPIKRERQRSGSLLGSFGKQGGGFSSSVGGYGGIQVDIEDSGQLDLGLDIGMDLDG